MDGTWRRVFVATGLVTLIATSDPLPTQVRRTPPTDLALLASHNGDAFLQGPSTAPGELGARLFRTHCATCHGTSARGDGPMAEQLRRAPPDLTDYTARNGGVFSSERVYRIVDGRDVPSHGDREMPVWGDVFSRSPEGLSDEAVKARIEAIVKYLQDIQRRLA